MYLASKSVWTDEKSKQQLADLERQIVLLDKQVEKLEDELKSDVWRKLLADKIFKTESERNELQSQHNSLIEELKGSKVYGAVIHYGDKMSVLEPCIKEFDVQQIIKKYSEVK